MMDHTEVQHALAFREDLPPAQRAELEAHLSECDSCRVLAADYDRQDAWLQSLSLPQAPPQVRASVLHRAPNRLALWPVVGLACAAAVLVVVFLTTRYAPDHHTAQSIVTRHARVMVGSPGLKNVVNKSVDHGVSQLPASPLISIRNVSMQKRNIRLTFRLPAGPYPRGAITTANFTVTNGGPKQVWLGGTPDGDCESPRPEPEWGGRYPQPLPSAPIPDCPFFTPASRVLLAAGKSLHVQSTILWGGSLRAWVTVLVNDHSTVIETPPLTMPSTPPNPIHATLHRGRHPFILVSRPPHSRGPLHVVQWYSCRGAGSLGGQTFGQTWSTRRGNRITPTPCGMLLEWHVVAGFPGHTVARLTYKQRD